MTGEWKVEYMDYVPFLLSGNYLFTPADECHNILLLLFYRKEYQATKKNQRSMFPTALAGAITG